MLEYFDTVTKFSVTPFLPCKQLQQNSNVDLIKKNEQDRKECVGVGGSAY